MILRATPAERVSGLYDCELIGDDPDQGEIVRDLTAEQCFDLAHRRGIDEIQVDEQAVAESARTHRHDQEVPLSTNVTIHVPLTNRDGKAVKLEAIVGMGEVAISLPATLRTPRVSLADLADAVHELQQLEHGGAA